MRVLLTGGTGLLGRYLLKTNQAHAVYCDRFDVLNKDAVYAAYDDVRPDIVIHCAGEGRVDFAERNRCAAWRNTYEGTAMMIRAAHYWESHFVFISSNAVYNGKESPCNEDTLHDPVNVYGRYKSECENLVKDYRYKKTIIRPILLYGWPEYGRRDNMVTRLLKNLPIEAIKGNTLIPIDNEIISQPTYAWDCASAIWKIIEMQTSDYEEFNVAASEKTTLFKFASQVAKSFDLDPSLITPVKSSEMRVPAKRPRDTTFGLDKLHKAGIVLRNQEEGLAAMRAEIHG